MSFHVFTQIMMANTVQSIEIPFLPTSIWGLMTGLSLILVLLACGMYAWYHKRFKTALKDSKDVADLAAEKEILEADIKQCRDWWDKNKEELQRLEAERQQQELLRQELANLQTKAAQEQQKVDDLSKESTILQNVISTLAQDRDLITNEITAGKTLLERIQNQIREIQNEAESKQHVLRDVMLRYEEEKKKFDNLLQNIAQYEIKHQSLIGEISAIQERLNTKRNELEQIEEKLSRAKADIIPLEELIAEKDRIRVDRDNLLKEKREIEEEKDKLKSDIDSFKKKLEILKEEVGTNVDTTSRYSDLFDVEPKCLDAGVFPGGKRAEDENSALRKVWQTLQNQGLYFPKRTLWAFHTSLKINDINPLTVLAGVSGTGKTRLPIEYAKTMGMHHLVISIQPRWDSPHDLFGFYNYMEHKFKATELARSLIRMDTYNFKDDGIVKRSDRILLVLLDEMNLARIEYYFSEFLSKLELRWVVKDEKDANERNVAEFVLEAGPRSSTGKEKSKVENSEFRLWVGRNVIFVGTMNEDESTQTLSDKVLDRANVLRFGKPTDNLGKIQTNSIKNQPQDKFLPFDLWQKWIKRQSSNDSWMNDVNKWIIQVNDSLEKVGRPFGHRVQQAMRDYVANYPGVDDGRTHKIAFADQIEQKVIPKLRGIDFMGSHLNETLDIVHRLIDELSDEELSQAFSQSKEDRSMGTFAWRGVTRSLDDVRV